jgi:hypothetical protein
MVLTLCQLLIAYVVALCDVLMHYYPAVLYNLSARAPNYPIVMPVALLHAAAVITKDA